MRRGGEALQRALCSGLVGILSSAALLSAAALATADHRARISERLSTYQEVPSISSTAAARFRADLDRDALGRFIEWELRYNLPDHNAPSDAQQAHLHFARRRVNGRIVVFLCTNLGNGPAGTQTCPPSPATIRGKIRPADVLGAAPDSDQGIQSGEFDELLAAIRAEAVYVNVHSNKFPAGETRAQLPVNLGATHD
jgi:CHRD domain